VYLSSSLGGPSEHRHSSTTSRTFVPRTLQHCMFVILRTLQWLLIAQHCTFLGTAQTLLVEPGPFPALPPTLNYQKERAWVPG